MSNSPNSPNSPNKIIIPSGFERSFENQDQPCIGVFSPAFGGKTRFCATASEWAAEQGSVPGVIIMDRKTKQTLKATCEELGLPIPLMSKNDYITAANALKLANSSDETVTKAAYKEAFDRVIDDVTKLAVLDYVNPIIFDSGTELWDWIGYANLGRREGVKARYWGPSKRDWKDLFEALKKKTVIVTFWARDEWKDDKSTGKTILDGPPHTNYTTTSMVRLRKTKGDTDDEKYHLDLVESIDNKGLEGSEDLLNGEEITFGNLMRLLRPED